MSPHERRRRAPFHYRAKADNARFNAHLLAHVEEDALASYADAARYSGNPAIAVYEAFLREASFSLESIIKSVVAYKIETGIAARDVKTVRFTHDLDHLWDDAGLERLSRKEMYWLLIAKQALIWSGRYAAPKNDLAYEKERATIEKYEDFLAIGNARLRSSRGLHWEEFDHLFKKASDSFWKIHRTAHPADYDL